MILITGAAGYIGRALIQRLEELHVEFRATDKAPFVETAPSFHPIERLDVTRPDHWMQGLSGMDTVIHLAAESDIHRCEHDLSQEVLAKNLLSIYLLLKAAKKHPLKKIIFPSSFSIYNPYATEIHEQLEPEPPHLYAWMKWWAEQLLLKNSASLGFEPIIFRQSNICGRGPKSKPTVVTTFVERWKNREPIVINGTGEQVRNFLDLRDCVEAYVQALLGSAYGIFNLGGPSTVSINQIAREVNKAGLKHEGYTVPVIHRSPPESQSFPQPKNILCNFQKIEKELGFHARYRVQDTIEDLIRGLEKGEKR